MTDLRASIVAEARSWKGTPWQHQARLKGVGVDCAGMVIMTARALDLTTFDLEGYGRLPDGEEMMRLCDEQMQRIALAEVAPGDAVCMRIARLPQHIGILVDHPHRPWGMVHASNSPGVMRVVEQGLDDRWMSLVIAAYRLPGVPA